MPRILLISDIHGNFPALRAVAEQVDLSRCDHIFNCGDSTVYAPFANQVLDWLTAHNALSILGNTDRKVVRLLKGGNFRKPSKAEKRIMYTHTAESLSAANRSVLLSLKKKARLKIAGRRIALFHGSPDDPDEFLLPSTPEERFRQLAQNAKADIVVTGHSHEPHHKLIADTHFINPGSVGRMFDGRPPASFALLELRKKEVRVEFRRCAYDVEAVAAALEQAGLPQIYAAMYRQGRKLN